MNKQFWYLLVHGLVNKKQGAYTNFYASGDHLGEALNLVMSHYKKIGLLNCDLVEADPLGNKDDFELPDNAEKIDEGLFFASGLSIYDLENEDEIFISPLGIIKSMEEGKYDEEQIKERFVAFDKDEEGWYSFVMTVDNSNIEKAFIDSLKLIPTIESFIISLEPDWENTNKAELWTNKSLVDNESIVDFVKQNSSDTIKNGFVTIIIKSARGETSLLLDSHKQISLTTKNIDVFNNFYEGIINMGFIQTEVLYSLENGFYHWHYRLSESKDKTQFISFLKSMDFNIIEN